MIWHGQWVSFDRKDEICKTFWSAALFRPITNTGSLVQASLRFNDWMDVMCGLAYEENWTKTEKKPRLMSSRSINDQCRALLWLVRRSITFLSDVDLGRRMKSLNDMQQYDKALHLIEKYNGHNLKQLSSMVITQALKACSRTGNLQYGSHVHHLVSSRLNNDPYIVSSLIHLYSRLIPGTLPTSLVLDDLSAVRWCAHGWISIQAIDDQNLVNLWSNDERYSRLLSSSLYFTRVLPQVTSSISKHKRPSISSLEFEIPMQWFWFSFSMLALKFKQVKHWV